MKGRLLLLLLVVFQIAHLKAQYYKAVVVDAGSRKPLSNISIQLKNTKYRTFSDAKGNFHLPLNYCFNGVKDTLRFSASNSDTLIFTSPQYHKVQYAVRSKNKVYELLPIAAKDKQVEYFNFLADERAFDYLDGRPLTQHFGEVRAVKFIYDFKKDVVYFFNFNKYSYHAHFAINVLKYNNIVKFEKQYYNNPDRTYFVGEFCHYTASNSYTFELFAGTEMTCEQLKLLYDRLAENSFVGEKLRYLSYSASKKECLPGKGITHNDLYKGQRYQGLNYGEAYGYLKFVEVPSAELQKVEQHDILVLNDVPLDIGVCAGIITNKFQMPLAHINVLSHNRGTPNMALRSVWSNAEVRRYSGKLVYLKVRADTFYIQEALLADAEKFWLKNEKKEAMSLLLNVRDSALVNLKKASLSDVDLLGGKAANFAELLKVEGINTPEGAFAIPFYFYDQHLKKYGLDLYINSMLHDIRFYSNREVKINYLTTLRDSIVNSAIDTVLLQRIVALIQSENVGKSMRFRSSTNAEDIDGFNGAGLYDSYTGKIGSDKKAIDLAIKKVWASLWNIEAVEERSYYKIDQKKVAMAVLVHRTFPKEDVNGVLITRNQYSENLPAYIINVQKGDVPVVSNEKGSYTADEIILFNFGANPEKDYSIQYMAHSNLPELTDTTVMSEIELVNLKVAVDKIFAHYCTLYGTCRHLDIEFKLDSTAEEKRKLYIKQVRLY